VRVLVCGSRTWTDFELILERLQRLPPDTEILHGGARGADSLADRAARGLGFTVRVFYPDWNPNGVYNPRAGFERSREMLAENPDLVLAFRDPSERSPGTSFTVNEATRLQIPVELYGVPVQLQLL
jgi:hypothetical protein